MNIGSAIRQIRKDRLGLTQEQFAEKIGISCVYVGRIESGKSKPSIALMERMSEILEIPIVILLFFSLSQSDIVPEKRAAFRLIKPSIDELIKTIL